MHKLSKIYMLYYTCYLYIYIYKCFPTTNKTITRTEEWPGVLLGPKKGPGVRIRGPHLPPPPYPCDLKCYSAFLSLCLLVYKGGKLSTAYGAGWLRGLMQRS